ncbi:MAG: hypothetical protein ACOX8W_07825 [bacterium]
MKKYFAPVVVVLLMLTLLAMYGSFFFGNAAKEHMPVIARVIAGGIILIFSAGLLNVLVQRINELRRGDEDDLSKY